LLKFILVFVAAPYFYVQLEVIRGMAVLKKATAIVNTEFGLDPKLADVIERAADEVDRTAIVCL